MRETRGRIHHPQCRLPHPVWWRIECHSLVGGVLSVWETRGRIHHPQCRLPHPVWWRIECEGDKRENTPSSMSFATSCLVAY